MEAHTEVRHNGAGVHRYFGESLKKLVVKLVNVGLKLRQDEKIVHKYPNSDHRLSESLIENAFVVPIYDESEFGE